MYRLPKYTNLFQNHLLGHMCQIEDKNSNFSVSHAFSYSVTIFFCNSGIIMDLNSGLWMQNIISKQFSVNSFNFRKQCWTIYYKPIMTALLQLPRQKQTNKAKYAEWWQAMLSDWMAFQLLGKEVIIYPSCSPNKIEVYFRDSKIFEV